MTDFETRLRETLHERADGAAGTSGLAAGARGRMRRRRRRTVAGVGVLAGAVITVPFLINQGDPPSRGIDQIATNPTSTSPTAVESPTDGLRTESWRDVTFEVPDSWGYGAPTGQCLSSASVPTVGRPSDIEPSVDCAGPGYGATVGPADLYEPASGEVWQYSAPAGFEPRYPDKAWVGIWYDDEVAVTVVTPTKVLTEKVVGSVRVIDGVDDNGCGSKLGFAESATSDGSDSLSVCRYDETDDLEWSSGLDAEQGRRLTAALEAAPVREDAANCPVPDQATGRTVVLTGGGYTAAVLDTSSCEADNGIYYSQVVRELTDDVRAALERPSPAG